nr:PREDICTED: GATA zinc finger domain-containing protein 10 [Bemisia tabaci]
MALLQLLNTWEFEDLHETLIEMAFHPEGNVEEELRLMQQEQLQERQQQYIILEQQQQQMLLQHEQIMEQQRVIQGHRLALVPSEAVQLQNFRHTPSARKEKVSQRKNNTQILQGKLFYILE